MKKIVRIVRGKKMKLATPPPRKKELKTGKGKKGRTRERKKEGERKNHSPSSFRVNLVKAVDKNYELDR